MRILLFGGYGMLGSDVRAELLMRGHHVEVPELAQADITDPTVVAEWVSGDFEWVINCAAYTAVDRAESEQDAAVAVNTLAPGYLGRACAMSNRKLLHVSTDFVFDGAKREPYVETDIPNARGAYAESKLDGERAVLASGAHALIARTAWLYGPNGPSFPRTLIRANRAGKSLRVVSDQVGSPTYTADLARVLGDLLDCNPEPGVYHTAGPDVMSWFDLAKIAITADTGIEPQIEPITTSDWPTPAPRPAYSALSFEKCATLGIAPMRPTVAAMAEFVSRLPDDV